MKFFVKCSNGGVSVVEPFVQVRGKLIQQSGAAGSRCSQQFVDIVRVVEAAHRLPCQSESPYDRSDPQARVLEGRDLLESTFRANGERRALPAGGLYLVGGLPQHFLYGAVDRNFRLSFRLS